MGCWNGHGMSRWQDKMDRMRSKVDWRGTTPPSSGNQPAHVNSFNMSCRRAASIRGRPARRSEHQHCTRRNEARDIIYRGAPQVYHYGGPRPEYCCSW